MQNINLNKINLVKNIYYNKNIIIIDIQIAKLVNLQYSNNLYCLGPESPECEFVSEKNFKFHLYSGYLNFY